MKIATSKNIRFLVIELQFENRNIVSITNFKEMTGLLSIIDFPESEIFIPSDKGVYLNVKMKWK